MDGKGARDRRRSDRVSPRPDSDRPTGTRLRTARTVVMKLEGFLDAEQMNAEVESVPIAAGAGDLIIWRTALPHGHSPNTGERPRVAQYITMSPAPTEPRLPCYRKIAWSTAANALNLDQYGGGKKQVGGNLIDAVKGPDGLGDGDINHVRLLLDEGADINIQRKGLKLWINLKKGSLDDPKNLMRDVSEIGHLGNGDYELVIKNDDNLEYIMSLVKQAFNNK